MFLCLRSEENRSGPLGWLYGPSLCPWISTGWPWNICIGKQITPPLCSVFIRYCCFRLRKVWEGPRMFFKKCLLKVVQGIVSVNLHPWTVVRYKMTSPWLSLSEMKSNPEQPWSDSTSILKDSISALSPTQRVIEKSLGSYAQGTFLEIPLVSGTPWSQLI